MFAKVNGKDVLGEPMFHNINGFVIKVWVILLGGCLTVKNQWGLLTGGDGTDPAKSISV